MNCRGSVWSKWDLHIHTPLSICNDYGGDTEEIWEKYITELENLPEEVTVIGINDYYFIDGFEKVMEYKINKGRLLNIKKIFPLLEFRVDTFASASESNLQKVNLHILFDIDDSNWESEVKKIKDEFIGLIKLSKLSKHQTKRLSIENFVECGGKLQTGFNEIIPSIEEVMEYVNGDTWKEKTFVLLGYKEWNNLDKGMQLRETKDNLFMKANAFFTAAPSDNIENKTKVIEKFGNKAILHSGDIHNFHSLKIENYRCFTWIKAEPTFEGLRQILFVELGERLKVQQNNPEYDEQKSVVIDSIKICNSNKWFGEEELSLNRGLISVIGEKGSGKTALLDLIAIASNEGIFEQDPKNPCSFYNRAKNNLVKTQIDIKHVGSEKSNQYILDGKDAERQSTNYGKVRYLSLKELESYCDDKNKLQNFIKAIIYSKVPETQKFDDLSKELIKKIKGTNEKIMELANENLNYKEVEKQLEERKIELNDKKKNEPKIKTSFTKEQAKIYKDLLTQQQKINSEFDKYKKTISNITDVDEWINKTIKEFKKTFIEELENKLKGIDSEYKEDLLSLKLDVNIMDKENVFNNLINGIVKKKEMLDDENKEIYAKIEPLEKLNVNAHTENNIIKNWVEQKKILEDEITSLELKITTMDETEKIIKNQSENRVDLLRKLFSNKIKQKNKYIELKNILELESDIKFDVNIIFDDEKLFNYEAERINHNMGNSSEVIKNKLKELYIEKLNFIKDEELDSIVKFISQIDENDLIKKVFGENRKKENLMKKSYNIADFYNIIYGDYYNVNYSIKFKGRELQSLSPGQKGLVLMKIFLRLDNSNKPLLIDQPEDNLDNKSVYKDLVKDLKEIKKRRQIIIATHNPNLVINTDSEQVIIAKFEDDELKEKSKITYISGALEDKKIKTMVCDILEGGDVAFINREKRYSINRNLIFK